MNVKQIKKQYTCLDILGTPVRRVASGYLYHAPWREDRHPSLSVSLDGMIWHDFATGEKGNIIALVGKKLGTNDLSRICAEFREGAQQMPRTPSFQTSESLTIEKEGSQGSHGYARFSVQELRQWQLLDYLSSQRGITADIARLMGCKEAHYSFRPDARPDLVAIAYPNDVGGYELRGTPYKGNSKGFKGSKAPKGITTYNSKPNAPWVIFEGFMDMLSFVQMCNVVRHNYIVLNSTANAETAITRLKTVSPDTSIYLYLDRDKAGDDATAMMLDSLSNARDMRSRFAPFNDVNDYLVNDYLLANRA